MIWDAGIPFRERIGTIKNDLVYLKRELGPVEQKIEELKKMVQALPSYTKHCYYSELSILSRHVLTASIASPTSQLESKPTTFCSYRGCFPLRSALIPLGSSQGSISYVLS